MLKKLKMKNFKGWENTGTINFSPITLFMGSNSSGKSSIGQFLMLLKQSCTSPDRKSVLFLGDSDSTIELGGPVDMLYQHDTKRMLEFEYQWTMEKSTELSNSSDLENISSYTIDGINFFEQIAVRDKPQQSLEIEKMLYSLYHENELQFAVGLDRVQKGGFGSLCG